jgi:hypothetical protein
VKQKKWFDVDSGGRVQLNLFFCNVVTPHNVQLGSLVVRGPHWTEGDFYDKKGQGLIIG